MGKEVTPLIASEYKWCFSYTGMHQPCFSTLTKEQVSINGKELLPYQVS